MGGIIGDLLGGLLGGGETPKVSTVATEETTAEQKKAQQARSALYSTEGGVMGQELTSDQVAKRKTLLGN